MLAKLPSRLHSVLTDNGIQLGNMRHQSGAFRPISDRGCAEQGIEHRFTEPGHPWPNGQIKRMNRALKEATVQRCHYQTTAELNEPLQTFLLAYRWRAAQAFIVFSSTARGIEPAAKSWS